MERSEAVTKLKKLEGVDLRPLAGKYAVTVWSGEKKNKGWAGHVLERYLGLSTNSPEPSSAWPRGRWAKSSCKSKGNGPQH